MILNTRECWLFSAYGMTGEVKWLYPGADKDTLVNIALYFLYVWKVNINTIWTILLILFQMVSINIALPQTTTKTILLWKLQSAPISSTTNCFNIAPHSIIKTWTGHGFRRDRSVHTRWFWEPFHHWWVVSPLLWIMCLQNMCSFKLFLKSQAWILPRGILPTAQFLFC